MDNMMIDIHEPRSDVIRRHVANFFRLDKRATEESFADDVKAIYHDRVTNENDRVLHFHEGGDAYKTLQANAQLLFRILKGTVKFPADIEEAVVLALPNPYRDDCLAELAGRYGLLPAHIPDKVPHESVNNLSRMLKETGDVIKSLSPILEDGEINASDAPHAKKALKEMNELMGALVEMQQRITSVLPDHVTELKAVR